MASRSRSEEEEVLEEEEEAVLPRGREMWRWDILVVVEVDVVVWGE